MSDKIIIKATSVSAAIRMLHAVPNSRYDEIERERDRLQDQAVKLRQEIDELLLNNEMRDPASGQNQTLFNLDDVERMKETAYATGRSEGYENGFNKACEIKDEVIEQMDASFTTLKRERDAAVKLNRSLQEEIYKKNYAIGAYMSQIEGHDNRLTELSNDYRELEKHRDKLAYERDAKIDELEKINENWKTTYLALCNDLADANKKLRENVPFAGLPASKPLGVTPWDNEKDSQSLWGGDAKHVAPESDG